MSTGVTTLTKLNTAQFGLVNPDSNVWVTTIVMTGPPKSFAVTSGGTATTTKTISGITITEKVADAFGVPLSVGNTFCIDLATPAGVSFGASPSLSVTGSGISTDLLQSIVTTGVGPLGTANSRITITIANAPAPGVPLELHDQQCAVDHSARERRHGAGGMINCTC